MADHFNNMILPEVREEIYTSLLYILKVDSYQNAILDLTTQLAPIGDERMFTYDDRSISPLLGYYSIYKFRNLKFNLTEKEKRFYTLIDRIEFLMENKFDLEAIDKAMFKYFKKATYDVKYTLVSQEDLIPLSEGMSFTYMARTNRDDDPIVSRIPKMYSSNESFNRLNEKNTGSLELLREIVRDTEVSLAVSEYLVNKYSKDTKIALMDAVKVFKYKNEATVEAGEVIYSEGDFVLRLKLKEIDELNRLMVDYNHDSRRVKEMYSNLRKLSDFNFNDIELNLYLDLDEDIYYFSPYSGESYEEFLKEYIDVSNYSCLVAW